MQHSNKGYKMKYSSIQLSLIKILDSFEKIKNEIAFVHDYDIECTKATKRFFYNIEKSILDINKQLKNEWSKYKGIITKKQIMENEIMDNEF